MSLQPEKQKNTDNIFKKKKPAKKTEGRAKRLARFFAESNWISNFSIIILVSVLLSILFIRPEPAQLRDYLGAIAVLIGLSATLMSNTKYTDAEFTPEHERGDKRLALALAVVAAFIGLVSRFI